MKETHTSLCTYYDGTEEQSALRKRTRWQVVIKMEYEIKEGILNSSPKEGVGCGDSRKASVQDKTRDRKDLS